jgi:hypothetical protein
VIRQAISCDICGNEKKQTNHWFVAYDQGGELRVSGWNSRNRLRPGSKHLCGQTCLHKLVDDFLARDLAVREQPATMAKCEADRQRPDIDSSLTSEAAFEEFESSARLIAPLTPIVPSRPMVVPPVELVPVPSRAHTEELAAPVPDELPVYASRNWRIEAWKREREREMRGSERRPVAAVRRRSVS